MNKELQKNINTIKQTGKDRFRIILDFATIKIVPFLVSDTYNYVWVYNHKLSKSNIWENRNLPILDELPEVNVRSKNVQFDFILETGKFVELLPKWSSGIQMIQMNKIPPDYFDPIKLKGEQRYQILKNDCDYLFELDIPSATDYGTIVSSNEQYLENLLNSKEINWKDLP